MKKINFERKALVVEASRIGVWDWNVQTGETYFNDRWAEIIGYTIEELQPISIDTWMKFAHPDDLKESNRLLEEHFDGKTEYYNFQTRMKHKNGTWVWVHDRGKVFEWDKEGKPLRMCGSHEDITKAKELELNLKKALKEKDILLSETHHRVKNNLQLIKSLMRLKQNKANLVSIEELETSIHAIASAHEAIYQSESFEKILLTDYLRRVTKGINGDPSVLIEIVESNLSFEISFLIPIGLIVTECLNNSLKYAFHERQSNKIRIETFCEEDLLTLHFCDNGKGFPNSVFDNELSDYSFGMELIEALADQINGKIELYNKNGACVKLEVSTSEITKPTL